MTKPEVTVVYLSSLDCPWEWNEMYAFIDQWCEANKASFYQVPGEDFFIPEAIEQAIAEGNSVVLVDSLS